MTSVANIGAKPRFFERRRSSRREGGNPEPLSRSRISINDRGDCLHVYPSAEVLKVLGYDSQNQYISWGFMSYDGGEEPTHLWIKSREKGDDGAKAKIRVHRTRRPFFDAPLDSGAQAVYTYDEDGLVKVDESKKLQNTIDSRMVFIPLAPGIKITGL